MTERNPNTLEAPQLAELTDLTRTALEGTEPYAGRAYKPIEFPLSWIFTNGLYGKIIGYRLDKNFRHHTFASDEIDRRIAELLDLGLIRSTNISIDPWTRARLGEYIPASLIGRKLVTTGEEHLFELVVDGFDSEGRTSTQCERFVFSLSTGLFKHEPNQFVKEGISKGVIEQEYEWSDKVYRTHYEQDPVVRALKYLSGEKPDTYTY